MGTRKATPKRRTAKLGNRVIKVFIASPGGLEDARRAFKSTIEELNDGFGDGCGVTFIALGWEDTLAPTGLRAQSEINKNIGESDVFLLVLDRLWGRRNKDAKLHAVKSLPGLAKLWPSNTMEEFSLALARFEGTGHPQVFPLFKKIPTDMMKDPGRQLKQVLKLWRVLAKSNCSLIYEWNNLGQFSGHVDDILRKVARHDQPPGQGAGPSPPAPPFDPGPEFRKRLADLETDLRRARAEKRRADQLAVSLAKRLSQSAPPTPAAPSREASRAEDAVRRSADARAERLADALAERAARAALEGRLEDARQDFAKALDGTTNVHALYLGYDFFNRIGELDEAERLLNRWLAISGPDASTANTAAAYGNLGLLYKTRGDLDQAEKMHLKALAIEEELGHEEGMASQYGNLGLICLARDDLERAKTLFDQALDMQEGLGLEEYAANQLGNLGLVYLRRGELDRAEEAFHKALIIQERLGLKKQMAVQYDALGILYHQRHDLLKAEEMFHMALAINKKLRCLEGVADNYSHLGAICQSRHDLDHAEELYRKALVIEENLGLREGMATNYGNLGTIYQARGDLDRAEEMLRRALSIDQRLGRLRFMATAYANLGLIYQARGDHQQARSLGSQARDFYATIGMKPEVAKIECWLAELPKSDQQP